jgi:hypothetical protein
MSRASARKAATKARVTPEAAWEALSDALERYVPPCTDDPLFTADKLAPDDQEFCAALCAGCPIALECEAYAVTAKVQAGYWAGHQYASRKKTR